MSLIIKDLYKSFAGNIALEKIDLTVESNEFVCLLGPSGCGKTTLLRIVAGLLSSDAGTISLDGKDLAHLPAKERGFGIVFQSYSLFPHMTIADNIGYGLKIQGATKEFIKQRLLTLLDIVKLTGMEDRYPGQLSGGQQQRVAIARALAVNPSVLLLDEPLSALDARVRAGLREEIREVQQRLGIPTLMVTHDQEEAMTMADKVVCMNKGRIEQIGTPRALYLKPKTRFVADFMGHSNLLPKRILEDLLGTTLSDDIADEMELCVRPERILLNKAIDGGGEIIDISFLGSIQRIKIKYRNQILLAETSSAQEWRLHEAVKVSIALEHAEWVTV